MLLGVGAVATKTYVDDVFGTYLYKGDGGNNRDINNGIDLAGEGGFVWTKNRDNGSYGHNVFDTVRGVGKMLITNTNVAEANEGNTLTQFNSNGFRINDDNNINKNNEDYASWSFRKTPGFFDVVTYTGTGNSPNSDSHLDINHSLNSIPGMLMVKRTDSNASYADWYVYHRGLGSASKVLFLNKTDSASSHSSYWNGTSPTASQFTVGEFLNISGATYVAYVFAGGESTNALARSVDFDGSGDYLSLGSTTDLNLTGDFTIEFWVYPRNQASGTRQSIIQTGSWGSQYAVLQISHPSYVGKAMLWDYDMSSSAPIITSNRQIPDGQWTHVAFTRSSGTIKIWINGTLDKTATGLSDSIDFGHTTSYIANHSSSYYLNAKLSNFRVVKGTAVYTSSFRPTYEPLTNITNTKLLCCNNSSVTGSTVTPGTITANGDPTASTDSPFDDPAGFVFGDSGTENVIKCGSYIGNGNADGPKINLGFEPQWVMIKWTSEVSSNVEGWHMFDSMRGIITDENDPYFRADSSSQESTGSDGIDLTPTGFKVKSQYDFVNNNGTSYIYLAIRRPDGYVGKPPELGSDCFQMATAASSVPRYSSGFPVDFAIKR